MKRRGISLLFFAPLTLTLSLTAQENPWNGSWQMDKSTLKYDGPTFTVTTNENGYTLMRGDKKMHKVVCDGKPNPPDDGTVTACTKTSTGYDLMTERDGKPWSKVKIEISPDGEKMTRTATISPPDDTPFTITMVSKRLSGHAGSPVVWKEMSFNESQETGLLTIMVKGDSVDFKETDADKPINCKLDGTPVPLSGKRVMSCKRQGTHTLKVTYSEDGKPWRTNTFVLSPNGQTVRETDVTAAPMTSTMSVLFKKA